MQTNASTCCPSSAHSFQVETGRHFTKVTTDWLRNFRSRPWPSRRGEVRKSGPPKPSSIAPCWRTIHADHEWPDYQKGNQIRTSGCPRKWPWRYNIEKQAFVEARLPKHGRSIPLKIPPTLHHTWPMFACKFLRHFSWCSHVPLQLEGDMLRWAPLLRTVLARQGIRLELDSSPQSSNLRLADVAGNSESDRVTQRGSTKI